MLVFVAVPEGKVFRKYRKFFLRLETKRGYLRSTHSAAATAFVNCEKSIKESAYKVCGFFEVGKLLQLNKKSILWRGDKCGRDQTIVEISLKMLLFSKPRSFFLARKFPSCDLDSYSYKIKFVPWL